ncbi:MAG: hypothetical protein ABIS14_00380 [Sphingomonas sp.]
MISLIAILLQAAPAATAPQPLPPAWSATPGTQSMTARAKSRDGASRLAVRCDARAEKVVSVQFIPTADIGGSPPPGRPVSLTIDNATPMIANWEFPGRGTFERDDVAVTTIAAAFVHARTIKLHTVDAAGGPIDAIFDGPPNPGGIVQVLGACGYTLGQVPVRPPAPADKPGEQ